VVPLLVARGYRRKKRRTADELYARLTTLVSDDERTSDLPDTVELTEDDIKKYYPIWVLWFATDRRFLPSQLMAEPHEPLAAMLEIDTVFEKVMEQFREQSDGELSEDKSTDTT
jgi:hypothetical protein